MGGRVACCSLIRRFSQAKGLNLGEHTEVQSKPWVLAVSGYVSKDMI